MQKDLKSSSVHSGKSIMDPNFRIKQLKLLESTLKEHFKFGMIDVGGLQKPLLASRALDTNQLRQMAFESKIESYYKQTN